MTKKYTTGKLDATICQALGLSVVRLNYEHAQQAAKYRRKVRKFCFEDCSGHSAYSDVYVQYDPTDWRNQKHYFYVALSGADRLTFRLTYADAIDSVGWESGIVFKYWIAEDD